MCRGRMPTSQCRSREGKRAGIHTQQPTSQIDLSPPKVSIIFQDGIWKKYMRRGGDFTLRQSISDSWMDEDFKRPEWSCFSSLCSFALLSCVVIAFVPSRECSHIWEEHMSTPQTLILPMSWSSTSAKTTRNDFYSLYTKQYMTLL